MITLQHVLHPTDFSDPANQALEYAKSLCARFEAELHTLHVLPAQAAVPVAPGGFVPPELTETQQEYRKEAAELLAKVVPADWEASHTVHRVTRQGAPFLGIIEYAKEADIVLDVAGTQGHAALPHVPLASAAW